MRRLFASVLILFATLGLSAQNVSDLIISEALARPDSTGIRDAYGRQGGWLELYNKSTGTVSFGGCFLTDDRADLRKSPIPKSDLRTKLGPRQSVLFFCSGDRSDGTFYTDFTLSPGATVYLVSNDGRTIIDSLRIPDKLPEGMSVAKRAADLRQMDFQVDETPSLPSPGILNGQGDSRSKAEALSEGDPHGWTLTIVSVSVVFSALAILWFLFWLLFDRPAKKESAPKQKKSIPDEEIAAVIALALDMEAGGDHYAAIAAAVHLYLAEAVHDSESYTLTIRKETPSAWSDKKLNFRKLPR